MAKHLAESMSKKLCAEVEYHSYTLPREREVMPVFDAGDVVVWATPVYAGRIPNKTLDYVRNALHGNGNLSVALVTFGNRAYDNALAELVGLMEDGGMRPIGAAAMVTRHVFSDTLGASRPNEEDSLLLKTLRLRSLKKYCHLLMIKFQLSKFLVSLIPTNTILRLKLQTLLLVFLKRNHLAIQSVALAAVNVWNNAQWEASNSTEEFLCLVASVSNAKPAV